MLGLAELQWSLPINIRPWFVRLWTLKNPQMLSVLHHGVWDTHTRIQETETAALVNCNTAFTIRNLEEQCFPYWVRRVTAESRGDLWLHSANKATVSQLYVTPGNVDVSQVLLFSLRVRDPSKVWAVRLCVHGLKEKTDSQCHVRNLEQEVNCRVK